MESTSKFQHLDSLRIEIVTFIIKLDIWKIIVNVRKHEQISTFGPPENRNSHYHNQNREELDIWKIIVNVGKQEQISAFGQPENFDRLVSKHSACNTFLILTHFDSEARKKVNVNNIATVYFLLKFNLECFVIF